MKRSRNCFAAEIAPSDGGLSRPIARNGQAAIHPISVFMGSRPKESEAGHEAA
jgi:hypothetical protein